MKKVIRRRAWPADAPMKGEYAWSRSAGVVFVVNAQRNRKRGGPIYHVSYCQGWDRCSGPFPLRGGSGYWEDFTGNPGASEGFGIEKIRDPVLKLRAALSSARDEIDAIERRKANLEHKCRGLEVALSVVQEYGK